MVGLKVVLKDGWVYRGDLVSETVSTIVLLDRKVGKIEIAKDMVAVLSREE